LEHQVDYMKIQTVESKQLLQKQEGLLTSKGSE
ncbi:hypothetical protein SAMN05192529_1271, partial [Arachidicoccus rhizosphaerae]